MKDYTDIIYSPVITEKSALKTQDENVYMFKVNIMYYYLGDFFEKETIIYIKYNNTYNYFFFPKRNWYEF